MKGKLCVAIFVAGMFLLQGCSAGKNSRTAGIAPKIEITPQQALVDAKVNVRVVGLQPEEKIALRAGYTDTNGLRWESHAEFVANANGVADLGSEAPISGTYRGVDSAGLFWSMSPVPGQKRQPAFDSNELLPATITFTADVANKEIASASFQRLFVAPSVIRKPVHENGLAGTLFLPAKTGRYPGVIVLGGSEGGLHERTAALLASHGFAALALAYFGYDGLPKYLVDIPIEYFGRAVHFMQSQNEVDSNELAVLGASRGGELALLLGSTFPQFKAVVAYVPSSVRWSGMGKDPNAMPLPTTWTYHGKPLPYMGEGETEHREKHSARRPLPTGPISFRHVFVRALSNPADVKKSTIDVEKINGPVLLLSGDDDQIWPSGPMSDMVMKRLDEYHHPYHDKHFAYLNAGHVFRIPNLPATITSMVVPSDHADLAFGGDAKGNAAAAAESWPRVLAFLHNSLQWNAK